MNMTSLRTHVMHLVSDTKICTIHQSVPPAAGINLRGASLLAKTAMAYAAQVHLVCGGQAANAKSVLDILALGALPGTQITVLAEGTDAGKAVRAINTLFASSFCRVGASPAAYVPAL